MPDYDVTIQAVVRKTLRVTANNESLAAVEAHQDFTLENEGPEEHYSQDVLSIAEVPPDKAYRVRFRATSTLQVYVSASSHEEAEARARVIERNTNGADWELLGITDIEVEEAE